MKLKNSELRPDEGIILEIFPPGNHESISGGVHGISVKFGVENHF
jgi:hypothetical protein